MVKNICLLLAFITISSCSLFGTSEPIKEKADTCPNVIIPRDISYVIQKVNYMDDFQIELTGFEGYCYFDEKVKRRNAMITPNFKVRRLRKNLDETDVDFTFFTETVVGPPEFLGKKSYEQSVVIARDELEKDFSGKQVKVKVPSREDIYFEIYLGIDLTDQERKYNDRIFDIKFRFEEDY